MSLLTDPELAAIARNHTRVAAIPTQAETLDMFAQGEQTEELTLCGQILTERSARARSTDRQLSIFLP